MANKPHERETYLLRLRDEGDTCPPANRRLARLLKIMLRGYGFRNLACWRERPEDRAKAQDGERCA
jgi:hypothetical protein